jgi:hypothetical protein
MAQCIIVCCGDLAKSRELRVPFLIACVTLVLIRNWPIRLSGCSSHPVALYIPHNPFAMNPQSCPASGISILQTDRHGRFNCIPSPQGKPRRSCLTFSCSLGTPRDQGFTTCYRYVSLVPQCVSHANPDLRICR